ncbi:CdaR family transcriptional regulator [Gordonibacter sp. 28C]|uniref:PucR family transcriptional regulator n=1 Tax=Gordonibacter sp. 28C TaxID=2078569 RepID=UPI001314B38F|nr:helix-turn-helix domain-containing protein [Gordonibacter sp. 28C]
MASQDFGESVFLAPTGGSSLPSVTLPMLVDFLADCEVLHRPAAVRRTFRWFAAVSRESSTSSAPEDVGDAHLLFVCRAGNAADLLRDKPAAFAVVLVADDEKLPLDIEDVADRLIAVRQRDRFSYFIFLLQSYFMHLLVWENELDRIVMRQGTLTELLDASTPVMKNFLFVSDNSFNVIARTTSVEPPDDLHRRIMDTGCLTPQMIAEKRQRLPEKKFYAKEPSDLTPYARLSHPIYLNHTYFGSLSMSCCNLPLTEGLKDLFSILMRHAMPMFERLWRSQVKLNIPHYFFFAKMLEHAPATDEYVRAQLALAALDEQTQFKLVVLEIDEGTEPERAALVTRAAAFLNQGCAFCFAYQTDVLALLYAPPSDARLSHRKTVDELEERVFEPYGVVSGVSGIFERITDLDLAYRQAKLALGLKNTIESELFAADEGTCKGVYLFDDALLYFLVDPTGKDERFMRFCFAHTMLQKIYREDQENDTNYLALFWFYLHSERNATAVAQRLHMHRNTVLYHIDKIQKRFDFDLSTKSARDRMLLDFKVFFLTTSHESIEQVFAEAHGGAKGD